MAKKQRIYEVRATVTVQGTVKMIGAVSMFQAREEAQRMFDKRSPADRLKLFEKVDFDDTHVPISWVKLFKK